MSTSTKTDNRTSNANKEIRQKNGGGFTNSRKFWCGFPGVYQLRVVEGLLFAPLKNNDIAIQHRNVARVGLDRFDGSLETGKWPGVLWQDFHPFSSFESKLAPHQVLLM